MELFSRFTINAARRLPGLPEQHVCSRLHGHTFAIEVHVRGSVDPASGWVMDFAVLDAACAAITTELDHRYLNDIAGLENPTSERIATWIWPRLEARLPGLHKIVVRENDHQGCIYRGPEERLESGCQAG